MRRALLLSLLPACAGAQAPAVREPVRPPAAPVAQAPAAPAPRYAAVLDDPASSAPRAAATPTRRTPPSG